MKFFGTFDGDNFEDYAKAIVEWAASRKQLADGTLNIKNSDGNLKIQPGNPDGSIKVSLSDKLDSISKEYYESLKEKARALGRSMTDPLVISETDKLCKDKNDSISKKFKNAGKYVSDGMLDAMAVAEAYKQYGEKNDPDSKTELKHILRNMYAYEEHGENIKMVVPTPTDTDEISRILHMSMGDTVDVLDDMASEMDAELNGSSIDELKERLPYLVALRKSIKLINGLKHLIDDWEKPCR